MNDETRAFVDALAARLARAGITVDRATFGRTVADGVWSVVYNEEGTVKLKRIPIGNLTAYGSAAADVVHEALTAKAETEKPQASDGCEHLRQEIRDLKVQVEDLKAQLDRKKRRRAQVRQLIDRARRIAPELISELAEALADGHVSAADLVEIYQAVTPRELVERSTKR